MVGLLGSLVYTPFLQGPVRPYFNSPGLTTLLWVQVSDILGRERVIFTDNGIAPLTHVDHLQHTPSNNPGTLESGLMDMALLSQCDDIVMTITSSFGYIAAAWGGVAPVRFGTP